MRLAFPIVVTLTTIILKDAIAQEQALFVKTDVLERGQRVRRQTSADQMVQNILQWLQGVYTENSRRIRQGTLREYLPPSNTQKPRPFEPVSPVTQSPGGNNYNPGYPPAGSITPQPPFTIFTNPTTGAVTGQGYLPPNNDITPPEPGYPSSPQPQPPFTEGTSPGSVGPTGYPSGPTTGYPSGPVTGYPSGPTTGYPSGPVTGYPSGPTTGYPSGPTTGFPTQPGYTTQRPGFPTQPPPGYTTQRPGYTSQKAGFPTQPPTDFTTGYPTQRPTFPTQPSPGYTTGYPSEKPEFPTQPPTGYPTRPPVTSAPSTQPPTLPPATQGPSTHVPITSAPVSEHFTSPVITTQPPGPDATIISQTTEDNNVIPEDNVPKGTDDAGSTSQTPSDDDSKHPPHIHAIDVQCAKEMMTINIEFNREFNGVIYSKGYYNTPECRYVNENSEQTKYKFTVSLNSCGTEFINAFDTQGQSYLENVLVLQNEPGIQEVWDTIRSVRCLWEGSLKESLSVALSVGMLSQEIVTFSGDTAMAKLDIQLGKGPFAPPANGLVKIGEPMTLVVSVSGDPGFDVQVKDCRATDSSGGNVVPLTDDNGCVLKPKLFGAFQKTRNTGNTGASIIAYASFNAFKFPDVMDLMIECNIELCKTDCQVCSEPNQKLEPGRRKKRDLYSYNGTLGDAVTMGKHLRVILPEDLNGGDTVINLDQNDGVCMSAQSFVLSSAILISLLTASSLFSAHIWLKNQRLTFKS